MTSHETKILRIIGAHGAGKTTIKDALALRLESCGFSVFGVPEMSYPSGIEIGTMDFQLWFRKQIHIRNIGVRAIQESRIVDYIIMDRDIIDIDVYTSRIMGMRPDLVESTHDVTDFDKESLTFLITAPVGEIMKRLKDRISEEEYRREWREENLEYLEDIIARFNAHAKSRQWIYPIENISVEDAVNKIMNYIY